MLRRLFTWAILITCFLWLVVSYLPSIRALLPTIPFTGGKWMAALAVVGLVAFVAIQGWLLFTTVTTVRTYQARSRHNPFRLRMSAEIFWTALPILMTIGLACASYALWSQIAKS